MIFFFNQHKSKTAIFSGKFKYFVQLEFEIRKSSEESFDGK